MKILLFTVMISAALALLVLLGFTQLIWAGSEASYYLHLLLGILILSWLVAYAQCWPANFLVAAVGLIALALTLMPFDTIFPWIQAILVDRPSQPGDLLLPKSAASNLLYATALGWTVRAVLLGLMVIAKRTYHTRRQLVASPT